MCLKNRSARQMCCQPACLGCLLEPPCKTSTASVVSQGLKPQGVLGVPCSGLSAGLLACHLRTKASAPWGRAHPFAGKWAPVFQELLTGEGWLNPQAASSTTACLPHTLPPGQWWKILNLYPETVSCITYRSELFIIPPGLQ